MSYHDCRSIFTRSRLLFSTLLCLLIYGSLAHALPLYAELTTLPASLKIDAKTVYRIRLTNGDMITGVITDKDTDRAIADEPERTYIKFKTDVGLLKIYADEISDIILKDASYRHNHRLFFMPTAESIGNNHFLGSWELLMLYGGAGIGDILSITAGRTIIPTLSSQEQFSLINAKVLLYATPPSDVPVRTKLNIGGTTVYESETDETGRIALAGGVQWTALQQARISTVYTVGTYTQGRSALSALLFYKAGGDETIFLSGRQLGSTLFRYPSGAFGVGLGLDVRFPERNDIHFIGELWNADISRPVGTAVILGIRLTNSTLSADFGIATTTNLDILPVVNFVWTPF